MPSESTKPPGCATSMHTDTGHVNSKTQTTGSGHRRAASDSAILESNIICTQRRGVCQRLGWSSHELVHTGLKRNTPLYRTPSGAPTAPTTRLNQNTDPCPRERPYTRTAQTPSHIPNREMQRPTIGPIATSTRRAHTAP